MHPTRWTSIFITVRQVSVVLPVESTEILSSFRYIITNAGTSRKVLCMSWCDEVKPMPSAIINLWARFKTPVGWWLVGGLYNLYIYIYQPLYWEFSHLIRGIPFLTNRFLKGRFHRVLAGEVAGRTMPWDRGWGSENTEAIGRNDWRNDESSVFCFGIPI